MVQLKSLKFIINKLIVQYETKNEKYHELEERYQTSIEKSKELLQLKEDVNYLLEIPNSEIDKILNLSDLTEEEQEEIKKYLSTIKTLLNLNETKQTSFEISNKQFIYVNKFIHEIEKLIKKKERKYLDFKEYEKEKKEEYHKYLNFYNKINTLDKTTYIDEIPLIRMILNKTNLNESQKRKVLFDIMSYNNEIFKNNFNYTE